MITSLNIGLLHHPKTGLVFTEEELKQLAKEYEPYAAPLTGPTDERIGNILQLRFINGKLEALVEVTEQSAIDQLKKHKRLYATEVEFKNKEG